MNPLHERRSGILLHPTSLPGLHGHGDLGPEAHEFLRFLARAGQSLWQMLPVVPPGGGDSPYDSPSSFAGSPELVSLRYLVEDGLLDEGQLAAPARLWGSERVRYGAAKRFRARRLRQAFQRFQLGVARHGLEELRERERFWLPDYALFAALKSHQHNKPWFHWPSELRRREPAALAAARSALDGEIAYHEFVQLLFDRQWQRLRGHARHLGVLLLGDIPMFVAHDGADVWQHQQLFLLDDKGERRGVAGVPPDYFSADGQRWGNPLYDWARLRDTGYDWWIERLRSNLRRFDAIRLDHFIGFHRYWEIPTHSPSAREGHFVEVPGHDFFSRARALLGDLPFIAEDLGIVTPEVEKLRDDFELPGMRVLAFAFADGAQAYLPHRFHQRCVVYTGTHDNDTMAGFLDAASRATDPREREQLTRQRERALAYAGSDGREPHWDLIRSALASVANTAIFPIQDVLGLGTEARMNVPGTPNGNWGYRLKAELLTSTVAAKLARLTETYERLPPASVAIRERLRRARLVALLLGLSHSAVAFAQMPVTAPPDTSPAAAAERPPAAAAAPPPPASPAPATGQPTTPPAPPASEPDAADAETESGNREAAAGREGAHVPLRYTLEAIQVRGNSRTERRVVLRYVPFKPGNVFDVDDPEVNLSRYRLLGTGFFRDVQFSLKKGSERGLVVLVIDVTERNTIVINDISMGLAADAARNGRVRTLSGYAGLDLAETNLAGTGITLGGAMAVASNQLALRVRFLNPAFLGTSWMVGGTLLYNDARDYFGTSRVQWTNPDQDTQFDSAQVDYTRFGGSIGVGRDLSVSTQLWLHYRLESLHASYPWEASQVRGFATEPIDFDIIRGRSVLSTLRGTLQVDTRDHPFLPTRGSFSTITTEVGLLPAGRDYDYARIDAQTSRWLPLPWHAHVLRLSAFAGAISGNAPFFEQYYVGDFSDFLPDRVLGVTFDHRYPPNFLGTEIVEVRYGKYALSANAEYRIPLYRGHHTIFGIDFFGSGGAYSVASDRDFTHPPRAYSGFARFPLDLTFNLGFRMDTSAGGFVFAFSNVLGFLPVRGQGPAGND